MGVMEEEDLELMLLACFYHLCKSTRDRSPGVPTEVDEMFGLPVSPGDLVSPARAVAGPRLALETYLVPRKAAMSWLNRGSADAMVSLLYIPVDHWTEKELEQVDMLEFEIKCAVHRLTEQHSWFYLTPQGGNPYDPDEDLELGNDGLTAAFKITRGGLVAALDRVPGSKYAIAPNLRDRVAADAYDHAPDWFKGQEKRRG